MSRIRSFGGGGASNSLANIINVEHRPLDNNTIVCSEVRAMDPSELRSSFHIIENLGAFIVNFEEPPYLGGTIIVLMVLRDARESERAAWYPWAIYTTEAQETSNYRLVTSTPGRSASELPWKHQMDNVTYRAEDDTDV